MYKKNFEFMWFILILALFLFVSFILYTFLLYASYFLDLNFCSDDEKERERKNLLPGNRDFSVCTVRLHGAAKKKMKNYMTIVYFVHHAALEIIFTICKLTTKK